MGQPYHHAGDWKYNFLPSSWLDHVQCTLIFKQPLSTILAVSPHLRRANVIHCHTMNSMFALTFYNTLPVLHTMGKVCFFFFLLHSNMSIQRDNERSSCFCFFSFFGEKCSIHLREPLTYKLVNHACKLTTHFLLALEGVAMAPACSWLRLEGSWWGLIWND